MRGLTLLQGKHSPNAKERCKKGKEAAALILKGRPGIKAGNYACAKRGLLTEPKGAKCKIMLQDAGFRLAFDSLKVKFKPTAKDMQQAEESGTDLAQGLLKQRKKQAKQTSSQAKSSAALFLCRIHSNDIN